LLVVFALLDADPDPATQNNADLDQQTWGKEQLLEFFLAINTLSGEMMASLKTFPVLKGGSSYYYFITIGAAIRRGAPVTEYPGKMGTLAAVSANRTAGAPPGETTVTPTKSNPAANP